MVTAETVVDGETLTLAGVPCAGERRRARGAHRRPRGGCGAREGGGRRRRASSRRAPGVVVFGGESRIILEFQDDNLQVFYLLDIVNSARTPIDIGEPLVIDLPEGAAGAGAMEGSSSLASVQGDRLRINGPFPPGTTSGAGRLSACRTAAIA